MVAGSRRTSHRTGRPQDDRMQDIQLTIRIPSDLAARLATVRAAAELDNPLVSELSKSQFLIAMLRRGTDAAAARYAAPPIAVTSPPGQGAALALEATTTEPPAPVAGPALLERLRDALATVGAARELAIELRLRGGAQVVRNWKLRGVPADKAAALDAALQKRGC
jgi:hypothetical protein